MSTTLSRCWAAIDETAIAANITLLRKIGPKIMAVVKANAYGHGIDLVAPALLNNGIRHFAVATTAEAADLRALPNMSGVSIYLIAAALPEDAAELALLDVIPLASDTEFVKRYSEAALKLNKTVRVHIEVDTGIGRAGVAPQDLQRSLTEWKQLPGIDVTGICTHFTAADASDTRDSVDQQRFFEQLLCDLPPDLKHGMAVHAANSPGTMRLDVRMSTFVRPGLLIYGIPPSPQLAAGFPYRPVLSLKARALLVRRLPAGSDISYSRTYKLPKEASIATVGIGYGDGYPRRLSGIGRALLPDGTSAPIRGRVCMDQICIEVPDSANVKAGDTVTLIGESSGQRITVSDIAALIDTTPHEITTCLTARVARISGFS